jgi:hypothetical protein
VTVLLPEGKLDVGTVTGQLSAVGGPVTVVQAVAGIVVEPAGVVTVI